MKNTLAFILILLTSIVFAQTKIYKGNSSSYSDCLYTLTKDKIYSNNSTSYSDCVFTVNGNKVYKGNSTSYSDCVITIDGLVKFSIIGILIGPY